MQRIIVSALLLLAPLTMAHAETVKLYAAGSLKAALTEAARDFEAKNPGATVTTEFAASGLLRERIEKGEIAHVFASADMGHPSKLADAGKSQGKPVVFARNQLCALARPGVAMTRETLLPVLLDEKIRLGVSTPKADPSGDYAVALFAKAEAVTAGARAKLEAKAQQLTGGASSPKAPEGRNLYAWVMDSGEADVFLTYCTNAVLARKEIPALQKIDVPETLAVGADYGLIVLKDAPAAAQAFANYIRHAAGQAILAKFGFGAGDPPGH